MVRVGETLLAHDLGSGKAASTDGAPETGYVAATALSGTSPYTCGNTSPPEAVSQRTDSPSSWVSRATTTSAGSCANTRRAVAPTCSRDEQWMNPLLPSKGEPRKHPVASKSAHSAG